MPSAEPASRKDFAAAVADVITRGEITVTGRLTDASNLTLLGEATLDGLTIPCIYKPVRGERPLWDFPDGTLAERELAAFLVSRAAGWNCVPLTVIRDGPYGPGMVQRWIEDADPDQVVDLVPIDAIPAGWLPVLRAVDTDGDRGRCGARRQPGAGRPRRVRRGGEQRGPQGFPRSADRGRPHPGRRPRPVLPHRRQTAHHPLGLGRKTAAATR